MIVHISSWCAFFTLFLSSVDPNKEGFLEQPSLAVGITRQHVERHLGESGSSEMSMGGRGSGCIVEYLQSQIVVHYSPSGRVINYTPLSISRKATYEK